MKEAAMRAPFSIPLPLEKLAVGHLRHLQPEIRHAMVGHGHRVADAIFAMR
jgi:hypothetical protein